MAADGPTGTGGAVDAVEGPDEGGLARDDFAGEESMYVYLPSIVHLK